MAAKSTQFVITVHRAERIIEVVYPSHPDEAGYRQYEAAIREAITGLGGVWDCLVDQRALTVAPPEVTDRIASLNAWAHAHGMRRTARVVKESAIAELQARRILKQSGIEAGASMHRERDEAWRALAAEGARPAVPRR